jgi:anaerobic dimethyl sulfoxide reductase subunit B (iron-sulfur subunit)
MRQYGFYFDQSRCIGCNACAASCKQWHGLPPGPEKWMRVYQWEKGAFPRTRLHFLAIPCYHCANPVCAKACPNGAIAKESEYGAVLIDSEKCDPEKCNGTRKCWKACPYGSIVFPSNDPGDRASKCTMCVDRLKDGKNPICVLSCSMRALEFGPMEELVLRFGDLRQLEDMPSPKATNPSVVFKAHDPKKILLPWDAEKALALWKTRGPYAPANAPDLFENGENLTAIDPGTVGRSRLVLKTRSVEEFMYHTTDND